MPVFSSGELNRKPPELDPEAPRYCRARAGVQSVHANPPAGIRVQRRHPTRQQGHPGSDGEPKLGAAAVPRWSEDSRLFGHPCFATRLGGVSAGRETQG